MSLQEHAGARCMPEESSGKNGESWTEVEQRQMLLQTTVATLPGTCGE